MAITPTQFIANYPEFAQAPTPVIQNELNNAYTKCPTGIWGAYLDEGAQLRACRALALSPFGRGMALVTTEGTTVYDGRLDDLIAIVAAGGSLI